ncbi:hypothetical protein CA13_37920 [Planctomycetes bacterium CA13]|uniref:Uncharacterized protein n=1 Tax=Novipirellula herctigrandis TaxID=2527986 RepID=A0A5C5Z556_9BACT|nr:hypothetical protein CA13_37920 [Planctomycetes bacterium CA13]
MVLEDFFERRLPPATIPFSLVSLRSCVLFEKILKNIESHFALQLLGFELITIGCCPEQGYDCVIISGFDPKYFRW